MVLIDTSVWIGYFRGKLAGSFLLRDMLRERRILSHPWVLGELMMGYMGPHRKKVLADLQWLPQLVVYDVSSLYDFVEREKFYGLGLSLVDVQLLYSARLHPCKIWTLDKTFRRIAKRYDMAFECLN